jgi:hypothetical protein
MVVFDQKNFFFSSCKFVILVFKALDLDWIRISNMLDPDQQNAGSGSRSNECGSATLPPPPAVKLIPV